MRIEYLYKYRTLNRLSTQLLTNRELYFAKADELNDPYEISLPVTFEGTDDQIRTKLVSQQIPPTEENVREARNPESNVRKRLEKHSEESLREARDKFGICSFSEVNDNMLLWSHYADCHRGFCLEFDANGSSFRKQGTNELAREKVKYSRKIPSNSYFVNTPEQSARATFLNKYFGWNHEREWRAFDDPGVHAFDPQCLKGVILGYRMPEHERKVIRCLLNNWESPIKLYEAKIRMKGEFGLIVESLID